jgi:hypothetical protein
MLSRRELLAGGAVMTHLGNEGPFEQRGSQGTLSDDDIVRELRALQEILKSTSRTAADLQVDAIRERQRGHLKVSQKFPDYIDIGIRVWERMQDWHVQNMRPLNIARAGDGRWHMEFIHSTLVLRIDIPDSDIGLVYDR